MGNRSMFVGLDVHKEKNRAHRLALPRRRRETDVLRCRPRRAAPGRRSLQGDLRSSWLIRVRACNVVGPPPARSVLTSARYPQPRHSRGRGIDALENHAGGGSFPKREIDEQEQQYQDGRRADTNPPSLTK
jgi:hypothetical protein